MNTSTIVPSTTPYFIRAIYEWCCDNGLTPYLVVLVSEHTRVPLEYVKGGEITLNICATASQHLIIGNDAIRFTARFNNVARELYIPINRVQAIFAREVGTGMTFEVSEDVSPEQPPPVVGAPTRPRLKIVK